ncbi:MAG: MBL fold metallo-hydrolase [Nitrospinaceae bacterium]|jgi:ribonuclease BN (tRNA processing enzyme)|nr:MBL fold metallo-hydrolase [Nitrospinaceae bacterium]MBT3435183.1 MBL fold metallo-hydrolase [Nitrospinaceae bacterium]MBT4092662.1 MBL fold metallo-hydrolase [Nitrospinaceae bacterium]MBT4430039.1 MBL fold metallo-hydrolase [Nitrospinaceae bacterium]MBT5946097.1 MBL fold metallo-hydrolase [Nitrospinaceae bacterium]
MELILLGTGSPPPDPSTSGHADGIVVNDRLYLLDAGRNVCRQISAAGYPVQEVDHLLFTHFHSDHFTGFADFYITRWLFGAQRSLKVWGPGPVEEHVKRMLHYYEYDIEIRAKEGKPREGLGIEVTTLAPGDEFELDDIQIKVDKGTHHGNVDDILSYRFEADGRVIVIASDGGPTEKLVPLAKGADVLVMHPCLPDMIVELIGQTPEMAKIIAGHHAKTDEIGQVATDAEVGMVILSHLTPPRAPEELVVEEVSRHFNGKIVLGRDLQRF